MDTVRLVLKSHRLSRGGGGEFGVGGAGYPGGTALMMPVKPVRFPKFVSVIGRTLFTSPEINGYDGNRTSG